jgi:hypothetical protein
MTKKERKKYGLLPPKIAESDIVSLDHGLCGSGGIGLFTKGHQPNTLSSSFLALTLIDPATGLFEIVKATNMSATSIQDLFHNTWFTRYPRPQFIVFDNEFVGKFKREIKEMCDKYGIKGKLTTSHSPQQMQSLSEYIKFSMTCSNHLT